MRLSEAKALLLAACEVDAQALRDAIAALPDRAQLEGLDPLSRALIETRLHQLVPLEIVR